MSMGVYIKGMELPKSCFDCNFCVEVYEGAGVYACVVTDKCVCRGAGRHDDCPLVPVSPHGRLIDADALRESIRESIEECHKWADEVDKDTMMYARISQSIGTFVECSLRAKAAPTIIEAEEGET